MNLPAAFIDQLNNRLDEHEFNMFLNSLAQPAPVSLRMNRSKTQYEPELERVPWNESGYYLQDRPMFVADPAWHAGQYYVQEASSMIVGNIVRQLRSRFDHPVRVLDLCGAPGGKSTDIMAHLDAKDLLVSNEVIKSRAWILYENVVKWGSPNHMVSHNDPKDFEEVPGFFDVLVVDAPCSGEGLFRKEPESVHEWSPENVKLCQQRQERIIWDCWDTLSEGGYLLYSTCTYNEQENNQVLSWMEENFNISPVAINLQEEWGFQKVEVGRHALYQALPHQVKGEGFSFFVIEKKSSVATKKWKLRWREAPIEKEYVEAEGYHIRKDERLYFSFHPDEMEYLGHHLKLLKPALEIGKFKKGRLIPSQELANSSVLKTDVFPIVELKDEQVMDYLKNQTFDLDADVGHHLVLYHGYPLGFINHLGNRFNNLFPQNWRIRSQTIHRPIPIFGN